MLFKEYVLKTGVTEYLFDALCAIRREMQTTREKNTKKSQTAGKRSEKFIQKQTTSTTTTTTSSKTRINTSSVCS
jgi:uncharacterized protein YdeI (YjbR/CyaY-like superfamily)